MSGVVLDVVLDAVLVVAMLMNLYAFMRHERARRRLLARFVELSPTIAFVAFVSSDASDAPPELRELARRCLPADARVDVVRSDESVH